MIAHNNRSIDAAVPESVESIPVRVRQRAPLKDAGCDESNSPGECYVQDYDPIPGGAVVEVVSGAQGTACCRVELNDTYYLMTARHLFIDDSNVQDSCSDNVCKYDSCYQNGDYWGFVSVEYPEFDAVLVELD